MTHRKMPPWLKKGLPDSGKTRELSQYLQRSGLETVCINSRCPNIVECFACGNVSFLIMGGICTRNCRFCAISSGNPDGLDKDEPRAVADAVRDLELDYVVITSASRDDLPDGGATHYAATIRAIKDLSSQTTVEALIPDLELSEGPLEELLSAGLDVLSHNIETVPRLFDEIRPQFDYRKSLGLLRYASAKPAIEVKSGFMLGLGEEPHEVIRLMEDIRRTGCSLLTIGQYLKPFNSSLEVVDYISPEVFSDLRRTALRMGFRNVASGPFVRSSYMADSLLNAEGLHA